MAPPEWRKLTPRKCKNTETKEMEKFTHLEALLFTAVLENCVDQLSILGYITPVPYEGRADISHIDSQEIKEITETQKELDIKYQELVSSRQGSGETVTSKSLKSNELEQQLQKSGDLERPHCLFNRTMKHRAMSADNLRKVQADREEEGKKEIKSLQQQLQDVKKETEMELQERGNIIAFLSDQLQEMKAKTDMESSYVKKNTELQVQQTQKKCSNAGNDLDKETEKLRSKTDEEIRVHMEIENFLRQQQMKVEEKLEYWMDKYEKDTEAKDQELNTLKESKANNLETLQRLASECWTFEETIISDRVEKEAARRQLEQDALELKSILKLQAWWRGTMVRRNLGCYKDLKETLERQLSKKKGKGKKDKFRAKKKKR
ncbi:dynein regulatory complex protein 9 isoform X4 [Apteryx rowi]|uniref:dynein regulatory complex protein 9 isoform X4 n=1 Tax=Apteryx rowi TaxID=308060 RepID=UPI000E1D6143|nr:dynein regulatory complex protein 9 isoform X4 [Apteryx rowi]